MTTPRQDRFGLVPAPTPRQMTSGLREVARAHSFGFLFGGIWALVGGPIFLTFAALMCVMPPFILGALIGGLFFFAGLGIVWFALRGTLQRQHILRHGTVVRGEILDMGLDPTYRVNRQSSTKITFGYTDASGQRHTGHEHLFGEELIARHHVGMGVDLVVDPIDQTRVLAPSLLGVTFAPAPIAEDLRPNHVQTGPVQAPQPDAPWQARLRSTLEPLTLEWWAPLVGLSANARPLGTIWLDGAGLHQQVQGWSGPRSVELERPFSVQLSTWLHPEGEAALHVAIRQHGDPTAAPVTFRVMLPQARVGARVALKQGDGPCLPTEDFDALWEALRYHASVHGQPLTEVASASTLPERAGHSAPRRAEVAQARQRR